MSLTSGQQLGLGAGVAGGQGDSLQELAGDALVCREGGGKSATGPERRALWGPCLPGTARGAALTVLALLFHLVGPAGLRAAGTRDR